MFARRLILLMSVAIYLVDVGMSRAQDVPRVDLYGDPLPAGVITRLGTLQFRHATTTMAPLAFSKDGKRLLSASSGDQSIRIWDAATGKQLQAVKFPEPDSYISAAAFSADGNSLAIAGPLAGVHFWNANRDKPWSKTSMAGSNRGLSMTPDGRLLAVAENGGAIRLWEPIEGKESPRTFSSPNTCHEVRLSHDGKLLAASTGRSVLVWDVASGNELHKLPIDSGGLIAAMTALSPDNKYLAAPNGGEQFFPTNIVLWDLANGKKVHEISCDGYSAAVFSPDGKWLAVAGNNSISVWDVATGKERRKLTTGGSSPMFTPDGRTLAYRHGATIHLWNLETGRPFPHRQGHQSFVRPSAFSLNGKLLASAANKEIILWDLATSKQLHLLAGHQSSVSRLAFSTDGKTLITASNQDRTVRRWDVAGGKELSCITIDDPYRSVPSSIFTLSYDRRTVVSVRRGKDGQNDFTIDGWDVDTGKALFHRENVIGPIVAELLSREGKPMHSANLAQPLSEIQRLGPIAHSFDGKIVAAGVNPSDSGTSQNDAVTLLETATKLELLRIPSGPITDLAFSPDGRLLLTSKPNAQVQLWDVATGKELLRDAGPESFNDTLNFRFGSKLAFSSDGQRVAIGQMDSTILIWDVNSSRWHGKLFAPTLGAGELETLWTDLRGVDGRKVHTAIWSLAAGGKPALELLKDRLKPTAEVDAKRIRQLIADLASERFTARDAASRELIAVGAQAEKLLRASLEGASSVEFRRRVESVLESYEKLDSPELLRRFRAIQVLESNGTPPAREVLEAVAKGAAGERETREAEAALQRLRQRAAATAR